MPCLEDLRLMVYLHGGFPLVDEPYAAVAQALGTTEQDVLQRLQRLLDDGYLTRFGPLFQIERAGGQFVLAALSAPEAQFDAVTAQVNALPEDAAIGDEPTDAILVGTPARVYALAERAG